MTYAFLSRLARALPLARPLALSLALSWTLPLAVLGAMASVTTAHAADAASAADEDGLVKVAVKGVDRVLQRPGTDWASYTQVLVAPVEVSFSRSWNPRDYGVFGLKSSDVDRIRRELSQMTYDIFTKVLAEGGYTHRAGARRGRAAGAPQHRQPLHQRARHHGRRAQPHLRVDAGEMTMSLELRDSITGTLLAEARDRKRGTDGGRVTLANRVMNRVEAERALRGWAMQLRSNLDAARKAP
jgi:hypothetical protein